MIVYLFDVVSSRLDGGFVLISSSCALFFRKRLTMVLSKYRDFESLLRQYYWYEHDQLHLFSLFFVRRWSHAFRPISFWASLLVKTMTAVLQGTRHT